MLGLSLRKEILDGQPIDEALKKNFASERAKKKLVQTVKGEREEKSSLNRFLR